MVRKHMEGDEAQKREAAREAHRAGDAPSEHSVTTGASKQRAHTTGRNSISHEERMAGVHRGKQGSRSGGRGGSAPSDRGQERTFAGRDRSEYTDRHERVFRAVTEAQETHGGEAAHLDDIARRAHLPQDETRGLLHDLSRRQGLVSQLGGGSDRPDQGPRYEVKPGM
ncbi:MULTISPECIES: hypothetical protein [Streptomyces]|uniref:Uncharacterized protein n=1 Tax=Streptomyces chilikensis TaxID=1194079 RepID=A0ABV3EI08_9ACTN|nr:MULTISPECIES: hypothetical protein [Streptomyces]MDH6228462.1 hypothetical protein [Streptomyces sp. MJP52]